MDIQHKTLSISILQQTCTFRLELYTIKLKNPFGTSHSITTSRNNALLTINILNEDGNSECGLPPKKAHCYYSDYMDVEKFFDEFMALQQNKFEKNPFQNFLSSPYFQYFLNPDDTLIRAIFFQLLNILDQIPSKKEYLAPKSLFECAFFDWYGKMVKKSVCELISPLIYKQYCQEYIMPSCYTLSLLNNIEDVLELITVGFQNTPYLKIKVGNNIDYVEKILLGIYERVIKNQNFEGFLCCDCNSSWTAELCLEFADKLQTSLKDLKPYLYMLEQPFPLNFLEGNQNNQWSEVKKVYQQLGVEIIADESVTTKEDVIALAPYSTGVNIKIEKSAGFRGAVEALYEAEKLEMHKWIGIMIGSSLNSTQASHIACLATRGVDLDGPLHIDQSSEKFTCGFEQALQGEKNWGKLKLVQGVGLCVKKK